MPSRPTSRPCRGCWRRSTRASSAPPRPPAGPRPRSSRAHWPPARRWPRPSARAAAVSPLDKARFAVGDKLALSKVRNALGPNDPVLITGAAPIGAEVIEFFYACGVPVLEGYGMTETCAAATLNTLDEVMVGSVGRPLPGTEVKIASNGEVLMRGPHIFKGYHRNQQDTDALLEDGWLHSGDLGELRDGYVIITGRQGPDHHLLGARTSRRRCSRARCARHAGSRRRSPPEIAAPTSSRWSRSTRTRPQKLAEQLGVSADPESMATDEKVREAVWKDIDAVNQRFARIQQIKRFAILPRDLSQEEGELTPTLKVKRSVVYKKVTSPTSTGSTTGESKLRSSRSRGTAGRISGVPAARRARRAARIAYPQRRRRLSSSSPS